MARGYGGAGIGGIAVLLFAALGVKLCAGTTATTPPTTSTPASPPFSASVPTALPGAELLIRDPVASAVAVNGKGIFWVGTYDPRGSSKKADRGSLLVRYHADGRTSRVSGRVGYPNILIATENYLLWTDGTSIFDAQPDGTGVRALHSGRSAIHIEQVAANGNTFVWRSKVESSGECVLSIGDREKRRIVSRMTVEGSDCGLSKLSLSSQFLVWTRSRSGVCHMAVTGSTPECDGQNASAATVDNQRVFATVYRSLDFFDVGGYESKKTLASGWNADDKLLLRDGYIYGSEREWDMKGPHPARIWRVGSNGAPELLAIRKDRLDNDFDVYGGKLYWPDGDAGGVFSLKMP